MGIGKKRHPLRILVALVMVVLVVLVGVSNFLVDFAFNPNAPLTMKSLMMGGGVQGMDNTDFEAGDSAAREEANNWYESSKESISLVAEDGTELLGWQIASSDANSHLYIVLCHGYTGKPADMASYAYHFYQRGYNVVLPAARAHERNEVTGYMQMGYQDSKDLVGWVNQIVAADSEARIVLMGTSMGGAEVMMASGWDLPSNVACIVEDCGYSSVWEELVLQLSNVFHLPSFPLLNITSFFNTLRCGYSFEEASSINQLSKASVPMLFIHGDADMFVPFSMPVFHVKAMRGLILHELF